MDFRPRGMAADSLTKSMKPDLLLKVLRECIIRMRRTKQGSQKKLLSKW